MKITIRNYQPEDSDTLADIFTESIHKAGPEFYSPEQVSTWAPIPVDYDKWQERFAERPPFVAMFQGEIVGFMTLANDGYVDWTYIHPDHHRKGIASQLYDHLELAARNKGLRRLYVDASHMAKSLFAGKGFEVIKMNTVCKGIVTLDNWRMEKHLYQTGNDSHNL
ncbi:GNAT family N-acetyltransferase [Balneola sp. MJW-20]|uniref:GNAT family N-acetyltransferase n=1 Tax=Gracilimonas aurantiaca TaxID=3234185 RepID=UPI003467034B